MASRDGREPLSNGRHRHRVRAGEGSRDPDETLESGAGWARERGVRVPEPV